MLVSSHDLYISTNKNHLFKNNNYNKKLLLLVVPGSSGLTTLLCSDYRLPTAGITVLPMDKKSCLRSSTRVD